MLKRIAQQLCTPKQHQIVYNTSLFVVSSCAQRFFYFSTKPWKEDTMDKYLKKRKREDEDEVEDQQAAKKAKTDMTTSTATEVEKSNTAETTAATTTTTTVANNSSSTAAWAPASDIGVDRLEELIEPGWRNVLKDEFKKPYWPKLKKYLAEQIAQHPNEVYPSVQNVFAALNHCSYDKVKVVVLGQDPYHGPNQAHGLSFSVNKGVDVPPSLKNMYKELSTDVTGFKVPKHGYLIEWADQGVMLLNAVLTVRKKEPNAHQKQGWETFTDAIVKKLNEKKNLVFMLWGAPAQKKGGQISTVNHCVLKAAHPSPLSASKGFFGCKHFSKCNQYLKKCDKTEINWQIN